MLYHYIKGDVYKRQAWNMSFEVYEPFRRVLEYGRKIYEKLQRSKKKIKRISKY